MEPTNESTEWSDEPSSSADASGGLSSIVPPIRKLTGLIMAARQAKAEASADDRDDPLQRKSRTSVVGIRG